MARIKEDKTIVNPKRYYIWTWRPKKYWNKPGAMANYKKHYCYQPYFTRYHAKKTAILHLGVDALQYIRVISGKALIKEGITHFKNQRSDWNSRVFIKGYLRGLPFCIIPPEYKFDKHRRRRWRLKLFSYAKQGRKVFNYHYALNLYGYTQNFSKKYLHSQRRRHYHEFLQEIQATGDI